MYTCQCRLESCRTATLTQSSTRSTPKRLSWMLLHMSGLALRTLSLCERDQLDRTVQALHAGLLGSDFERGPMHTYSL